MRQRLETRLVSTCFALYTECVCAFTWDVYKTATKYTCHQHTLAIMPAHVVESALFTASTSVYHIVWKSSLTHQNTNLLNLFAVTVD